jgi:hypothetical protein
LAHAGFEYHGRNERTTRVCRHEQPAARAHSNIDQHGVDEAAASNWLAGDGFD